LRLQSDDGQFPRLNVSANKRTVRRICSALRSDFVQTVPNQRIWHIGLAEGIPMMIMSGWLPRPLASIALVATLLVSGIAVGVPAGTLRAEDCLTTPNAPATQGQHWYYRTDKAKQRKCWYLRPLQAQQHAQSSQPTAAQPEQAATGTSASVPAAPTAARPQPEAGTGTSVNVKSAPSASVSETPSAGAPVATSPGDGVPFSPNINMLSVAPQVTPIIGATVNASTQQGAAQGIAAPPMPQAIAPQRSPLPTAASAPADSGAAPDSQPAASTATAPSADASGDDARASADAESATADRAAIAKPSMAGALKSAPLAMFLLPIFGLAIAGFLVRVVAKMTAARSEPNINTNADSGWIDDYDELEWHEDRGFREIVDDRHEPNFEQHALDRTDDYDELQWHEDRRLRETVDDRREPSFNQHGLDPIDHFPAETPKPNVRRGQNPAAATGAQPRAMVDEIEALLHAIRQARRHRAA
jgi:hypothetical protein